MGKKNGRIIRTSFYSGLALVHWGGKKKTQLLITVDNGPGISKNIVTDILIRSVQQIDGTGLGLPLVAKIISEHGGLVEVDDGSWGMFQCVFAGNNLSKSERIH